jgi:hypothetical protein
LISGFLAFNPATAPLAFGFLVVSAFASAYDLLVPNEITSIRAQMDASYWLEVKRQIHCAITHTEVNYGLLQAHLANAIENIVPFNGRSIKPRPQLNNLLANLIQSLTPAGFDALISFGKNCWTGNTNGLMPCNGGCLPDHAMVPMDNASQYYPLSNNVAGTMWWRLQGGPNPSGYGNFWHLPYDDITRKILAIVRVISPTKPSIYGDAATTSTQLAVNSYNDLDELIGAQFNVLNIISTNPFDIYVLLGDAIAQPLSTPVSFVDFTSAESSLNEGETSTNLKVRLVHNWAPPLSLLPEITVQITPNIPAAPNFTITPTGVTFPAGSPSGTEQTVTLTAPQNSLIEPDTTYRLQLTNPTGGAIVGAQATHGVIVRDFDPQTLPLVGFPTEISTPPLYLGGTRWRATSAHYENQWAPGHGVSFKSVNGECFVLSNLSYAFAHNNAPAVPTYEDSHKCNGAEYVSGPLSSAGQITHARSFVQNQTNFFVLEFDAVKA